MILTQINKLISEYLIHSYAYYIRNESLISDNEFDDIVKCLLDSYDLIKDCDHPHKHLIKRDLLESYTGFNLKFPVIVKVCFNQIMKEKENSINDLF